MQTDRMLVLSILGHEISCLLEEDNVSNKPYVRAYDGNAYDGDGRRVVCLERNPAIYTGILFPWRLRQPVSRFQSTSAFLSRRGSIIGGKLQIKNGVQKSLRIGIGINFVGLSLTVLVP